MTRDGWKRIPTVLRECEEEYDFDAALENESNCHRLEEGRPWQKPSDVYNNVPMSNSKESKSIPNCTNRTPQDDKVTFEAVTGSSKSKCLGPSQKKKYRVVKYVETVNTSRWPGWRWANFYYRTLVW